MWDVQLQRRAVMNEMRQMAARPFASVEMQLNPENKLLTVEQPSPVSNFGIGFGSDLDLYLGMLRNSWRRSCCCGNGAHASSTWSRWCATCRRFGCLFRLCNDKCKLTEGNFQFLTMNFSITKNMNLICFWIHLMKSDHVMGISETIQTNPPFQQRDITEKTILVHPLYVPIYCLSLPNCAAYFTCSHLKTSVEYKIFPSLKTSYSRINTLNLQL